MSYCKAAALLHYLGNISARKVLNLSSRMGSFYEHNSYATGRSDSQGLGFVIRNEGTDDRGHRWLTWSGTFELKQMWIDEAYRGRGYARALLTAFVTEACSRGAGSG